MTRSLEFLNSRRSILQTLPGAIRPYRSKPLLHSGPSEPFTLNAGVGRLFVSRLRGRAVQRTPHDSEEFGAFCFVARSVMRMDQAIQHSKSESMSEIDSMTTPAPTPD